MATPDLMDQIKNPPKRKRKPKPKTADTIASDLENEAKRLLHAAMLIRGKDRMQLRVKK